MKLDTQLTALGGIGKKCGPRLKKLGVSTTLDLLNYLPYAWNDLRDIGTISDVTSEGTYVLKGTITHITSRRTWKKNLSITQAVIKDDTGQLPVVWFNQPYIAKHLQPGDEALFSGTVKKSETGYTCSSPEYEKITKATKDGTTHIGRITPKYSLTAGITQKQIRYLVRQCLPLLQTTPEWLPTKLMSSHELMHYAEALRTVHFPEDYDQLEAAQQRLKFDELFLIQLHALLLKNEARSKQAWEIPFQEKHTKQFVSSLPFTLTGAQKKAGWEIIKDLEKEHPGNRLLEGDVGSGKTVVAALALLNVARSEHQAAYLAPTEVLAIQIYSKLCELLGPLDVSCALLTRSESRLFDEHKEELTKPALKKKIAAGDVQIVIGTHAIIQKSVDFASLAFVIVDEQHRFGISQRHALLQKGAGTKQPHFLSMSATPIPRSLALTIYGDLDLSVIDELPPGRKAITTTLVPPGKRKEVYGHIQKELAEGRQVYVICPLIDPSDTLGVKSATDTYKHLQKSVFPKSSIEVLHGKMSAERKADIFGRFNDGSLDILVSTTVVEVGVDVPNATIIMIEGADRFGLAQLHQLRGRVGRGEHESHCYLFTDSDSEATQKRLQVLVRTQNGFELAEADLDFRGPGEVYGVRQSGFVDRLKIAKLTDYPVIQKARQAARDVLHTSPTLEAFPAIKKHVDAWEKNLHLE